MNGKDKFSQKIGTAKKVGVDTQMFVYHFEEKPNFVDLTRVFYEICNERKISVVTSAVSVAEVFSNKKVLSSDRLMDVYSAVFEAMPGLKVVDLGIDLSKLAGGLRVRYRLRLPDAFQLAAAVSQKCDFFVTNDKDFKRVSKPKVLMLSDFV